MSSKKANWVFLITIVCYIGLMLAVAFLFPFLGESLVLGNLLCEVVIMLPIIIFTLASKEKPGDILRIHRIKFRSVPMIALFTLLSMPVLSLFNLITQLWVENEVAAALESYQAAQMPFLLMFLSMGIIAPVFEEITCRGAYYNSYRKSGSGFQAMLLSALIFAVVHMNFNQAAYAFIMGIFAVLLVEATGSIWSSVLYHAFINGSQVILLYSVLKDNPGAYSEQAALMTSDLLICAIAVYLFIAAVTLPLAWAVLVWIGRSEGRSRELAAIWQNRKEKKDKMVTVPFVLALILCIVVMTGLFYSLLLKIYLGMWHFD